MVQLRDVTNTRSKTEVESKKSKSKLDGVTKKSTMTTNREKTSKKEEAMTTTNKEKSKMSNKEKSMTTTKKETESKNVISSTNPTELVTQKTIINKIKSRFSKDSDSDKTKKEKDEQPSSVPQSTDVETNQFQRIMKSNNIKSIEIFLSYIGCKFPHFIRSLLPLAVIHFIVIFIFEHLDLFDELFNMKKTKLRKYLMVFSKHKPIEQVNIMRIAEQSKFVGASLPYLDLAIISAAVISITTMRVRYKRILLVTLGTMSLFFLGASHLYSSRYFPLFVNEIAAMIYSPVITVLVVESVPKFHRITCYALFCLSGDYARLAASTVILNFGRDRFVFYDHFYNVASVALLFAAYFAYFWSHDTLFNLLTLGKFARLELAIRRYLTIADIPLPASKMVDHVAFENFEPSDSVIEMFLKICRTNGLVYEVLVCALIAASLDTALLGIYHEIEQRSSFTFFEITVISPIAALLAVVFVLAFSVFLKSARVIPSMLAAWIMFITYEASIYTVAGENEVYCEGKDPGFSFLSHVLLTVCISMGKIIRLYTTIHLLERVPSVARVPVLTFLRLAQFMFAGTATELKVSHESTGVGYEMCIIPMLIFLLTPKKKVGMTIFFSKPKANQRIHENLDPGAPIVK